LPASLEVSTKDISFLPDVAQILKNEPTVEEVIFQEDVVKALHSWTSTLRKIGVGLIGVLGLVSLLIILVIVGMKITMRREEIEILQLLGATSWYIRAPFVLEGIFYGIVGAFLAWGVSYLLLLYVTPFLVSLFLSSLCSHFWELKFLLVSLSAHLVACWP
jgi:cell division transport system permease protein